MSAAAAAAAEATNIGNGNTKYNLYLRQERVHPFGEGLLLDVQTLLLERFDSLILEFVDAIALRHVGALLYLSRIAAWLISCTWTDKKTKQNLLFKCDGYVCTRFG